MLLKSMKRYFAELLGTFTLVFTGTGSIIVDQASEGALGHVGVSLVFGLVIMAMIYAFGNVSGAHLNPVVTIGLAVARRFSWHDVLGYICAQMIGAFAASLLLRYLFEASTTLGETLPSGNWSQSFLIEMVLTAVLMMVILSVSSGRKKMAGTTGITVGAVVGLGAMFAGPISGGSFNPARSLAPAIISGKTDDLWLYPSATLIGALIGVCLCCGVHDRDCCRGVSV